MYHAVIMAGGSGTRLWPVSRRAYPKQLLNLYGDNTMIEDAVTRIAPLFAPEQVLIVTRAEHVPPLAAQVSSLPAANFIVEPVGRGTGPAIGLAALHLHRRDPEAVMAVLTADHVITKPDRFCEALSAAAEVAATGALVTLGITPNAPSTGYGYIRQGEHLTTIADLPVYRVKQFTEKPNLEKAVDMVNSGEYMFNSGMFVWRVDRILEEIEHHMPIFYQQLQEIAAALDTPDEEAVINRIWPQVVKETIDYGIMEKAANVAVIPVEIGWHDIGSWASLPELIEADAQGNTVVGSHVGVDTQNSLIFNQGGDRVIATIGVEDLVIVTTDDAILICTKEREQDVRAIVDRLEKNDKTDWL